MAHVVIFYDTGCVHTSKQCGPEEQVCGVMMSVTRL